MVTASRFLALRRSGLSFKLEGDALTVYGPSRARDAARAEAEGIKQFLRLAAQMSGPWEKGSAREAWAAVVLASIEEEAEWSGAAKEMALAFRDAVRKAMDGEDHGGDVARVAKAGKRYIDEFHEYHRPLRGTELANAAEAIMGRSVRRSDKQGTGAER